MIAMAVGAAAFRATPVLLKDKPHNISKGEPRRSKFIDLDEAGNQIKPEKKQRTPEEMERLDGARAERELRVKENRAKQREIQRKREEREAAKKRKDAAETE
jgi:hypothetical protein